MFAIAAVIVTVAVFVVSFRSKSDSLSLAALTAAALLLYPQTLDHYGVLLIVPVLALWEMGRSGTILAWVVHTLAAPLPPQLHVANTAAASAIALTGCVIFAIAGRLRGRNVRRVAPPEAVTVECFDEVP